MPTSEIRLGPLWFLIRDDPKIGNFGGGHLDWSPLRKFATMKIQVPHFRGGFGITPNEGSAISAFYSATCALVVWLGSHGGNRPAQDFADAWAPGLNLTSPDS